MFPRILSLAGALVAVVPLVAGCAEEAEAGEAAYPGPPIGYTPPGQASPPPPVSAAPPAPPGQWGPPPADAPGDDGVAIGVDDDAPTDGDGGGYSDTDPSALSDFHSTLDPLRELGR